MVTGVFFALLLVIGLCLVGDYGVTNDEDAQRDIGLTSVRYVAELFAPAFVKTHPDLLNPSYVLSTFKDRDYGVAFEMPVAWADQALGFKSSREMLIFRHFCTFLVCVGGVAGLYCLAKRRFRSWPIGLVGALMLVLSPRLFGEMFYNSKDAVFLAAFAIATNTVVAFVKQPDWRRAGWSALACALAIDVRLMAVLLPAAATGLVGLRVAHGAYPWRRVAGRLAGYLGLLGVLVVLFWPYLWENPPHNFYLALHDMARFPRWNGTMLYAGELVPGSRLPWHYGSVWIGITTPILYLLGFLAGGFLILKQALRRGWRLFATDDEWQDLLFLGLALAPLVVVVALRSVLYDGWRQLYFVYGPLLLVSLRGLVALGSWRPRWWQVRWRQLSYAALGGTFLAMAGQIRAMHPLQNTYFNALAGRHVESRFEIDYWTGSYRKGLEWILAHDRRPHIRVAGRMGLAVGRNISILPEAARNRLKEVAEIPAADYFVSSYFADAVRAPAGMVDAVPAYTLRVGGQRVLVVYARLRPKLAE